MKHHSIKLLLAVTTCLLPVSNALAISPNQKHQATVIHNIGKPVNKQRQNWLDKAKSGLKYIFVDNIYNKGIRKSYNYSHKKLITEKNYKNPAIYIPTIVIGLTGLTYVCNQTVCNKFIAAKWESLKKLFSNKKKVAKKEEKKKQHPQNLLTNS